MLFIDRLHNKDSMPTHKGIVFLEIHENSIPEKSFFLVVYHFSLKHKINELKSHFKNNQINFTITVCQFKIDVTRYYKIS